MAETSSPLDQSLAELSRFFIGDKTLIDTLHRVAALAVEGIEPADFCGLTMLIDGKPRTSVFTDVVAPEIDQAQYDAGSGPCLDSFRTGEIFLIDSTVDEGPWPEFREACRHHGIFSTASFPMVIDGERHGAMNLYSQRPGAFKSAHIATCRHFAAQAGVMIGYARSYWSARQVAENLERALGSRAEIEQAKGIIIGSTGCTADEAFEILARQSQHENRKLRDVAIELVQSKMKRPGPPAPGGSSPAAG